MSSYGEKFNGNICNHLVVDSPSMLELWTASERTGYTWEYDPNNTAWNWYDFFEETLDEEGEAAIAELEAGDEQGVAYCRALYDLNFVFG